MPAACRWNWQDIGTCSTTASTCCWARIRKRLRCSGSWTFQLTRVVERRPFELHYPDGFRLQAARLPAPWHLAAALTCRARADASSDRAAMIGLLRAMKRCALEYRQRSQHRPSGCSECGQTPQVVRRVWRPLALAALNTPLDRASAQIFASVLRDSLGAAAAWPAKCGFRAPIFRRCFPKRSNATSSRAAGTVLRDARVERIERKNRFHLQLRNEPDRAIEVDAVVYAAASTYLQHIIGPQRRAERDL